MATITAAGAGNLSNGATWTGGIVPGDGDIADLNGFDITMDIATFPASGTLLGITAAGNAGTLIMGGVAGANVVNATTLTAGTKGTAGTFQFSGTLCTSLTINCTNLNGCAAGGTNPYGLVKTSTKPFIFNGNATGGAVSGAKAIYVSGNGSVTISGNFLGGSGNYSDALYINAEVTLAVTSTSIKGGGGIQTTGITLNYNNCTTTITSGSTCLIEGGTAIESNGVKQTKAVSTTLTNCNMKDGTGGVAWSGVPPTWVPGAANYWEIAAGRMALEVAAANLKTGITNGTVVGTRTDCPVAKALDSQSYGGGGTELTGTYHEATVAEVEAGVMFGPASAYEGTLAAGGLTVNGIVCA